MAIDKAIDSSLLDGALSASAEAIRAKTGDVEPIPFDAVTGFASAIAAIATGGGTLGIKTGTVTLSESYIGFKAEHGCGKLPYAFFLCLNHEDYKTANGNNIGAVWMRDEYSVVLAATTTAYFNAATYGYLVPSQEPEPYSLIVNESMAQINPARKWIAGTYHWIALYEV